MIMWFFTIGYSQLSRHSRRYNTARAHNAGTTAICITALWRHGQLTSRLKYSDIW